MGGDDVNVTRFLSTFAFRSSTRMPIQAIPDVVLLEVLEPPSSVLLPFMSASSFTTVTAEMNAVFEFFYMKSRLSYLVRIAMIFITVTLL